MSDSAPPPPVSTAPAGTAANAPIGPPARRALLTIFLIVLTDLIGFGMILPLLPYYAKNLNATETQTTLLFGCFSLFQFIFTPIWGRLSDRIGRRPVLVVSMAVSAAMYALFGYADSLWLLFVARIGAGIGTANIGTAQAYIADILPPHKRSVGMGILGAGFGLGFIIGPALGGLLTWRFGPHMPGYVAGGLSLLAMVMAALLIHEAPNRKPARGGLSGLRVFAKYWRNPAVRSGWLIIALDIFALAVMEITLSLWLLNPECIEPLPFSKMEWLHTALGVSQQVVEGLAHGRAVDPDQALTIGLGMGLIGLVMAIIQGGMIRRLAPKYGERKMLLVGIWFLAAGLLLLPVLGHNYWTLTVVVLMQAVGQSLIQPSNFGLISRNAEPHEQGAVMGIGQSISSLMRFVGPAVTGLLIWTRAIKGADGLPVVSTVVAYSLPFYVGGVLVLVALLPWRKLSVPEIEPGTTPAEGAAAATATEPV